MLIYFDSTISSCSISRLASCAEAPGGVVLIGMVKEYCPWSIPLNHDVSSGWELLSLQAYSLLVPT